jgi:hypothetical protein
MVLIVMVIEGNRLLAMGGLIGVIAIEPNGRRGLGGAGQTMIDHGGGETGEVLAVNLVCKTGDGGGTRPVVLRVQGTPPAAQCAQRGMAETVRRIPVRIARGDVRDTLG